MNAAPVFAVCGGAAYLLGAVPFGFLVARFRGVDIRRVGSGNIGATNVFRCVGKTWGILTFACDVLKGFIAAFVVPAVAARIVTVELDQRAVLAICCACLAVAGHNWPVYLQFKGGKGIATSAGALLGIAWQAVIIGILSWIIIFIVTHYVSVASVSAALILALAGWFLYAKGTILLPIALSGLALAAVWRHKANIRRLLNGTESRFEFGRKKKEPDARANEDDEDSSTSGDVERQHQA